MLIKYVDFFLNNFTDQCNAYLNRDPSDIHASAI